MVDFFTYIFAKQTLGDVTAESKQSCIPIISTIEQLSKCIEENLLVQFVYFAIIASVINLGMYFFIYLNDIRLFKQARGLIIRGVFCLIIFNIVIGLGIYWVLAQLLYPIYQQISQIPAVKLGIFLISCCAIIDIMILNRDEEYVIAETDNLFSGFGLGTGISWLNYKVLGLINLAKGASSLLATSLFDRELEDKYKEPLKRELLEKLNAHTSNKNTDDFINALRARIERAKNYRLLQATLEKIVQEYRQSSNNRDKIQRELVERKLVELAIEVYSTSKIEEWRNGNLPF